MVCSENKKKLIVKELKKTKAAIGALIVEGIKEGDEEYLNSLQVALECVSKAITKIRGNIEE